MLARVFCVTVSQKQKRNQLDHQQQSSSEKRAHTVDRSGTRKMAIPSMGSRIISVKHARASLWLWPKIVARERISLPGICRAVGFSLTGVLPFIVECFATCPDDLHVWVPRHPIDVVMRRLEAEADEMWSFVKQKANRLWIWIAMDEQTRQVIAFHGGDRSRNSAIELWAKIPVVLQEADASHRCNQIFQLPLQSHEGYCHHITCAALPTGVLKTLAVIPGNDPIRPGAHGLEGG